MHAIIIAGGLGSRLRPYTSVLPKPLLPVCGSPIIKTQIDHLARQGFRDVHVVTNYQAELFDIYLPSITSTLDVKISIHREEKPLGPLGYACTLISEINRPCLVLNGDVLFTDDLADPFKEFCRNSEPVVVITSEEVLHSQYGVIQTNAEGFIQEINEKPRICNRVAAGLIFLKPEITAVFDATRPAAFGVDYLVHQVLSRRQKVSTYHLQGKWFDVGTPEALAAATSYFSETMERAVV